MAPRALAAHDVGMSSPRTHPLPAQRPPRRLAAVAAHVLGMLGALAGGHAPSAAAAPAPGGPPALAAVAPQDVNVLRHGQAFSIDVVMHAPVAVDTAWAVLTDFGHMTRYQPQLERSTVLQSDAGVALVQQSGSVHWGPFSSHFDSVRELHLDTLHSIRAHQLSSSTLRQMDSLLQLEPVAGGTRLHYHAEVEPDVGLPPLIGPAWVQRETAAQFSSMIDEMVRRQTAPTADPPPPPRP